jgi:hypothetical protein
VLGGTTSCHAAANPPTYEIVSKPAPTCVDHGKTPALYKDGTPRTFDIDNPPRQKGATVDIGAQEKQ